MTNTQARHSNIEQILRITNDLLQRMSRVPWNFGGGLLIVRPL